MPKRIKSELQGQYRVFDVWRHRLDMGPGGPQFDAFTLEMSDWVTVVAMTPDERIVLIRQKRYGVDAVMLETPGGIIDDGEQPMDAALRELREETGLVVRLGPMLEIVERVSAGAHYVIVDFLAEARDDAVVRAGSDASGAATKSSPSTCSSTTAPSPRRGRPASSWCC